MYANKAQIVVTAVLTLLFLGGSGIANSAKANVDFGRDILPVLADRCFACHGPDPGQRKAELRLDLEDEAKKTVIVAGDSATSELIRRISSDDLDVRMPPPESSKPPLTAAQVSAVRSWIDDGAQWAQHWSHIAPESPALPEVAETDWARNEIDHFILARLDEAGLQPSPEAAGETLVRRLSFDLTGLPPTLEMIDAFLADGSDRAYERIIDQLLASPDYGEHMARDWLDGARYADTNGYQNDFKRNMWPWRDWVINAFNSNMTFDQFTVEQIAGDLLPDATDSQRIATGFHRNNRANTEGGSIEEEWRIENIIDRVETTGAVFLGLSIGCARCHEHKYDPISNQEFYEFFAFFNSTADIGFYNETRGNAGPTVSLPSFENQVRMTEFDRDIDLAQRTLDDANAARPFAYEAWRAQMRELSAAEPVSPTFKAEFVDKSAYCPNPDSLTWSDGLLGRSVELDGSAEAYLELGQAVKFDREQPFSISLWARPDASGALFGKIDHENAERGVDVYVSSNGRIRVRLISAWSGNGLEVESVERWKMGIWTHICVTYDGSSKPAGVRMFANGIPVPLETKRDSLTGPITTEAPLQIGRRPKGNYFKGAVADFQYFDAVLEPNEISGLVESAISPLFDTQQSDETKKLVEDFYDLLYSCRIGDTQDALSSQRKGRADYVKGSVPTVMVMRELDEPRPTYRLKRGAYDAPDTSLGLNPGIPAFLPALPEGAPSNRLGLAQWLVDPSNPLTARVTVNRYWQMIFGRGLVKTAEDFGLQGSPPSHPELLDWLAVDFVSSGWDVKALLKRIAMSTTYRQSSVLTGPILATDPEGILLASAPRYRFTAEVLRDNALAVSGLLTRKVGGPSVKPYQPEGLWAELAGGAGEGPYVLAEGDDLYRRSLYTYRKRTVPPPVLATFDSPGWDLCRVRRGVTNTPLQALALLNDVTYAEAARNLAERMLAEGGSKPAPRIVHGFRLATGRHPTKAELKVLENGLDGYLQTYAADMDAATALIATGASVPDENLEPDRLAAYTSLASVILNLDESITRE